MYDKPIEEMKHNTEQRRYRHLMQAAELLVSTVLSSLHDDYNGLNQNDRTLILLKESHRNPIRIGRSAPFTNHKKLLLNVVVHDMGQISGLHARNVANYCVVVRGENSNAVVVVGL